MSHLRAHSLPLVMLVCAHLLLIVAPAQAQFDLTWNTIDGGGTSAGGAFSISGAIGQPDASNHMIGGPFSVTGGFWSLSLPSACPADIEPSGSVNVNDLLAVINGWGGCALPCPPTCAADVDDNCQVNINDLLAVINAWGPCP